MSRERAPDDPPKAVAVASPNPDEIRRRPERHELLVAFVGLPWEEIRPIHDPADQPPKAGMGLQAADGGFNR